MKRLLAPFALLLLVITGCSGNVTLDNPRDEAVTFVFDGGEGHEVDAKSMEVIDLDAGNHSVKVTNAAGEILGDTTFRLKEAGIVHSGAGNYLIWRQLYGLQKDRKTLLNESLVAFDSVEVMADLKVFPPEWLYIEKSWDYDLDEEMPQSKTLPMNKDFVIESKIFRSKDFVDTYKNMAKKE